MYLLDHCQGNLVTHTLGRISTLSWVSWHKTPAALPKDFSGRLYYAYAKPENEHTFRRRLHGLEYNKSISIPPEINEAPYTCLADTLYEHGERANLLSCAREFKDMHKDYADPLSALGACHGASCAFIELLRRRNAYVACKPKVECWPNYDHAYVRIGSLCIDWTYRQFNRNCSFPHIYLAED